jgi:hypothetical protein
MRFTTFLLGTLLLLTGCQQKEYFKVTNPGNKKITDLATVVSRHDVNQFLPDTTTGLPVIVKDRQGKLLPSQCDDMDGDGSWDELVFLCDQGAGESIRVTFEPVEPAAYPVFNTRTHLRFCRASEPHDTAWGDLRMKTNDTKFTIPVYQMEGPAWENDIVAFRNYYDARNGIDIYGKRVNDMVLDSVGINDRNYHELASWGMDILKVGNSLGAGAIAIGIGDSLYRIGPCEEGRFRLISQGPVRTVFELTYKNVPAGDRFYSVKQRISIYAGDNFYRNSIQVDGLKGDEELVTGIVDMHALAADLAEAGDLKIMSTWGKQSMNGDILGMAVIFPASEFKRYWEAPASGPGIVNTHLVSLGLSAGRPTTYAFVAAWELQDQKLKDKVYFGEVVKEAAGKLKDTDVHRVK